MQNSPDKQDWLCSTIVIEIHKNTFSGSLSQHLRMWLDLLLKGESPSGVKLAVEWKVNYSTFIQGTGAPGCTKKEEACTCVKDAKDA